MKILFYTPDHAFSEGYEALFSNLSEEIEGSSYAETLELLSAREVYEIYTPEDLKSALMLNDMWDAVIVACDVRTSSVPDPDQVWDDLTNLGSVLKSAEQSNFVLLLETGTLDRNQKAKVQSLGSGFIFIHEYGDGLDFLNAQLIAAAQAPKIKTDSIIKCGPLEIDLDSRAVHIDGKVISFTNREFEVLDIFARKQGTVVSKESAYDRLYGYDSDTDVKIINVMVSKIRKKISKNSDHIKDLGTVLIQTAHSVGFRLIQDSEYTAYVHRNSDQTLGEFRELEWFNLDVFPSGEAQIIGSDVILPNSDRLILESLSQHIGKTLRAQEIAEDLFPHMTKPEIMVAQRIRWLSNRLARVSEEYANIIIKYPDGQRGYLALPKGMSLDRTLHAQKMKNTDIHDFGWFKVHQKPAIHNGAFGEIYKEGGGSGIWLSEHQFHALKFMRDHAHQWFDRQTLVETIKGSLPFDYKYFRLRLREAVNKLKEASVNVEEFYITRGNKRVLFVDYNRRENLPEAGSTTRQLPEVPKFRPNKTEKAVIRELDLGKWFTLAVLEDGSSRNTETSQRYGPSLTKIFEYVAQHPEELLDASVLGPKLFPNTKKPETAFSSNLERLRRKTREHGYPDMFVARKGLGTFFCPKGKIDHVEQTIEKLRENPRGPYRTP